MAARDFDAIFLVEAPVEIEYRDGMFHVRYAVGREALLEIALPPRLFLKAMAAAEKAVAVFRSGQGEIVPMRRKRGHS